MCPCVTWYSSGGLLEPAGPFLFVQHNLRTTLKVLSKGCRRQAHVPSRMQFSVITDTKTHIPKIHTYNNTQTSLTRCISFTVKTFERFFKVSAHSERPMFCTIRVFQPLSFNLHNLISSLFYRRVSEIECVAWRMYVTSTRHVLTYLHIANKLHAQ